MRSESDGSMSRKKILTWRRQRYSISTTTKRSVSAKFGSRGGMGMELVLSHWASTGYSLPLKGGPNQATLSGIPPGQYVLGWTFVVNSRMSGFDLERFVRLG
jgi:hypothetical protein